MQWDGFGCPIFLSKDYMIETIGWVSQICLAISAIPQAYDCWKRKSAEGISLGMIVLWMIGEVFGLGYVLTVTYPAILWPLVLNYTVNTVLVGIICYYKRLDLLDKLSE